VRPVSVVDTAPVRILWLSADVPVPADSGRRAYSSGMLHATARAGAEVVVIANDVEGTGPPDADGLEWRVVDPGPPVQRWRSVFARWPSMTFHHRNAAYEVALERALQEHWDAVIVDHLIMGWTMPAIRSRGLPLVYLSQNHESSVRRRIAASERRTSLRKLPLRIDAGKAAALERRLVEQAALVTAVTPVDASLFEQDAARALLVVSPGYERDVAESRRIDESTPAVAIVIGNLDWHVKQANLRRLLDEVDGRLHAAGQRLRLIGKVPEDFVASLEGRLVATEFVGYVDSLEAEIRAARVGVISERLGGGFKVKALDYVFNRLPMVVLEGSMAGLPLQPGVHYWEFPDEESLAEGLVRLLGEPSTCDALQRAAFDQCAGAFEWADRGVALIEALEAMLDGAGGKIRSEG